MTPVEYERGILKLNNIMIMFVNEENNGTEEIGWFSYPHPRINRQFMAYRAVKGNKITSVLVEVTSR